MLRVGLVTTAPACPLAVGLEVRSVPVLDRIAREQEIDMPIVAAVASLLQGESVDHVLEALLSRPPRPEAH